MDVTPAEAARRKTAEAQRLMDAQRLEDALACLDKAIFLAPEDPRVHEQRARVLWALGDVRSALASFRRLLALEREPAPRIKAQAAALLDLRAFSLLTLGGSPGAAVALLDEAVELDALTPVYWLHRAVAHVAAGCLERALEDVDHCVCLDGGDAEYFVLRAKLLWRLHRHDQASRDIARAAALRPDHPEVLEHEQRRRRESQAIYERARRLLLASDFSGAAQSLTAAIDMAPGEPRFFLLRAAAHRALGDLHVALADVEHALRSHRRRRQAAGDESESPDASREFQEIAAQRGLLLHDLAQRFLRERRFQLALNAMNQVLRARRELAALTREPFGDPQHFQSRGDAYRGLGNLHAAMGDYQRALELLPESREVRARIGHVHYSMGIELFNRAQFAAAELEFTRALAADASVAAYHARRGDAARFQEKHEHACADYLRALALDPRDQDSADKLRQYSVSPPSAAAGAPSGASDDPRGSETAVVARRALSPVRAAAKQPPSKLTHAREAYERSNQLVQELFERRPALPSVKKR